MLFGHAVPWERAAAAAVLLQAVFARSCRLVYDTAVGAVQHEGWGPPV
jgi:hypothetical protein